MRFLKMSHEILMSHTAGLFSDKAFDVIFSSVVPDNVTSQE